jgi:KDO2-lipid IV(A) lauroyltransferase
MYRSLARGLVEVLWLALSGHRRRLQVDVPDGEIEAIVRSGRGAVVATAHTGNWDLAACAVAARAPLTVVTKRLSIGVLDRLWQGIRSARGVTLVQAGSASRNVARALRRGELVAMLIDQAPERERGVTRALFLGAPVWVDLAPALCALRSRVPLVIAFPRRTVQGGHVIDVHAVLRPPPRTDRRWAVEAMLEATRLLDAAVRRDPAQWLWMHRRWKDPPCRVRGERVSPGHGRNRPTPHRLADVHIAAVRRDG